MSLMAGSYPYGDAPVNCRPRIGLAWGPALTQASNSLSFDRHRCLDTLRTAIATAFFCPTGRWSGGTSKRASMTLDILAEGVAAFRIEVLGMRIHPGDRAFAVSGCARSWRTCGFTTAATRSRPGRWRLAKG